MAETSRRVVVAGGSGFIGSALLPALSRSGYEVVVLSRSSRLPKGASRVAVWDAKTLGEWRAEIDGAFAVINLNGKSVACRWTESAKREMVDSRIDPTAVLGRAMEEAAVPPQVWINASGTSFYGDTGAREVSEATGPGSLSDFLVQLSVQWEGKCLEARVPTRRVIARIGFVLGRGGQGYEVLRKFTLQGLGGAVGSGDQFISWIHVEDLVRMLTWLLEEEDISGPVNAVSPNPVPNAVMMAELRRSLKRLWAPPVPAGIMRLFGNLVGPDASLALQGQRVAPQIALGHGFTFEHPDLRAVLERLAREPSPD